MPQSVRSAPPTRPRAVRRSISVAVCALLLAPATQAQSPTVEEVDAVFETFAGVDRPGCSLGVSRNGQPVLERAYGMANLEYDVPNTPTTIFEPGSVSKQFTAAATILLSLDGKLSLDDDIRDYIPELPDYGETITIRHLINHTSGLRDWGSVAAIGGWPRTTRTHNHVHMLDIASRQTALNYQPGEYYSYTNTGYNLQVVLVERVSGKPFEDFSRDRIFDPLGMAQTSWRADYTRVVKNRATAYRPNGSGGYAMLMPFENVHGNGGLLTTVADLLRFTQALETGELGGQRFNEEMHRQGALNSGRTISYAGGLFVGEYKGIPEVRHSGATAGYRGFLTRFPDHGLAVAVMCNVSRANAGQLAHQVADLYLGDLPEIEQAPSTERFDMSSSRLEELAGGFRRLRDGAFYPVANRDGTLLVSGMHLHATGEARFGSDSGATLVFSDENHAVLATSGGDEYLLERVEPFAPGREELEAYAGTYTSEEAEVTYRVVVEAGRLRLVDRYDEGGAARPLYPDAFQLGSNRLFFERNDRDAVTALYLSQSRVWRLRFDRVD